MELTILCCMGLVCIFLGPVAGESLADELASVPIPGGVADADGKVAYVVNAGGGAIDAIDLDTGETRWTSRDLVRPIHPLIAWDHRLAVSVGQPGPAQEFKVFVLDTEQKEPKEQVVRTWDLPMPTWSRATGSDTSFQLSALGASDATLALKWSATVRPPLGVNPQGLGPAATSHRAAGTWTLDLATGRVTSGPAPPEKEGQKPFARVPDVISHPYREATGFRSDPLVIGRHVAALSLEKAGGKATLVLKRWDRETGREQPSEPLATAQGAVPLRTLDGGHLILQLDSARPDAAQPYRLVALEPGRPSVDLALTGQLDSATVLGKRIYLSYHGSMARGSRSRTLVAFSLPDGKQLWSHAVEGVSAPPPRPKRPG
jgi:hypothetical protein